jgi:hypothetical protein
LVGAVEESPLLEAVTVERLVKTADCAVVIFKVWKLAMALYSQLNIVISRVVKCQ